GLKFFFYRCLGYEWALFTKKKVAQPRQKRIPYVLPKDDCLSLIGAIRSPSYRLCCSVIYTLGLRIGEALSMKVNSIDSKQMIVRIIGKGNKERVLPLPESLLRELRSFWQTHHDRKWLFPNKLGSNHLNRRYFYTAFGKARKEAGLSPDFKPHCLRHCFATHLLTSGVEIHVVQMLMGHANIKSTQIYTHQTEAMRDKLRKRLDDIFGNVFQRGQNNE
ncbi:MAG: tyrosine-type recombinase/integrase, partial [Planctomycetota bacterium]|nr:tyrosine-type recombinase/integrase [Planctomycetota bacterium]